MHMVALLRQWGFGRRAGMRRDIALLMVSMLIARGEERARWHAAVRMHSGLVEHRRASASMQR
ncbi:hypothetical protein GCM10023335_67180 [Streptomyces siamensis]|uniref:Uncharacterized protein n=1 Tax=Streptomyces siamensis TaxID=1274986 RepID=A0ABP9JDU1_9ACTN